MAIIDTIQKNKQEGNNTVENKTVIQPGTAEKKETVYIPNADKEQKVVEQRTSIPTVIVALCHPHGIYFNVGNKRRILIKGNACNIAGQSKGQLPQGGYGLTRIRKSDWEEITKRYGELTIFKKGLIFAHESKSSVVDEANEKAELRHGREPIIVEGNSKQSQSSPAERSAM